MGAGNQSVIVEFDCGSRQYAECAASIIKVNAILNCVVTFGGSSSSSSSSPFLFCSCGSVCGREGLSNVDRRAEMSRVI